MPRERGSAVHLQVRVGQQRHFGSLEVFNLVGRHFILQLAVRQILKAVGVDGVIVDRVLIHRHGRFVEEAFRADIPVAHGCKQRRNDTE